MNFRHTDRAFVALRLAGMAGLGAALAFVVFTIMVLAGSAHAQSTTNQNSSGPQAGSSSATNTPGSTGGSPTSNTPPKAQQLTSTVTPGRQSWLSDRRDFQVGDIITIQVDENTLTSLDKRVDATDSRHRDLGLNITTPSATKQMGIGSDNNATSQTRGTDARTNRLVTQMSARVVEIGPNRTMRLEGTKSLHVEQSVINITLTGWTRAQDVDPQNVLDSSRLADAKLDYQADGPLGTPKSGLLGRILGKLWP